MDLKAKYLLETCSDPIGFLNQLRQTTEPIGGGTVYSEDGELVEYDVAVEAIKKATDAFMKKVENFLEMLGYGFTITDNITHTNYDKEQLIKDFRKYMEGEWFMRVIRKSSEKEIICSECGSILYYETKDIHLVGDMEGEYSYCVKCPECNNHIKVL